MYKKVILDKFDLKWSYLYLLNSCPSLRIVHKLHYQL